MHVLHNMSIKDKIKIKDFKFSSLELPPKIEIFKMVFNYEYHAVSKFKISFIQSWRHNR